MDNEFTPHLTGQEVVGQRGESIGKAADVLYDDEATERPTWVRVDHGLGTGRREVECLRVPVT